MLPRLQSYLLADGSQVWPTAGISSDLLVRHEHQLFPGLAVLVLVLAGLAGRFRTEARKLAWLNLAAALALVILTLEVGGFSLYKLVWHIPGLNSIRSVTRIMLVVMWPLSVFMAWAVDGFIRQFSQHRRWMQAAVYLVVGLLVAESVFYTHTTYAKADAQARLDDLRQQIPASIPAESPILVVAMGQQGRTPEREIDAMLLAQELGWPTLNGYSGNYPPGYATTNNCKDLPQLIKNYMDSAPNASPSFTPEFMTRVVPLGFADCDPNGPEKMP